MTDQIQAEVVVEFKALATNLSESLTKLGKLFGEVGNQGQQAGNTASTGLGHAGTAAHETENKVKMLAESFAHMGRIASVATLGLVEPVNLVGERAEVAAGKVALLTETFKGLGQSVAFLAGGAALGLLGLALVKVTEAGAEGQQTEAELAAAYHAHGLELETYKERIDGAVRSMITLNFAGSDTRSAIMLATRAGIAQTAVFGDMSKLADIAAAKHMTLAQVQDTLIAGLKKGGRGFGDLGVIMNTQLVRMLALNDKTAAYTYVVDQLGRVTAGQATAASKTFSGEMGQLQKRMGELAETVGLMVIPTLTEFAAALNDGLTFLQSHQEVFAFVAAAIVGALVPALVSATGAMIAFTVATLANPVTWLVIGIAALVAVTVEVVQHWSQLSDWFGRVWAQVGNALLPAFNLLKIFLENPFTKAVGWAVGQLKLLWDALTRLIRQWLIEVGIKLPDGWGMAINAWAQTWGPIIAAAIVAAIAAALLPGLITSLGALAANLAMPAAALGTTMGAGIADALLAAILAALPEMAPIIIAALVALLAAPLALKIGQAIADALGGLAGKIGGLLGKVTLGPIRLSVGLVTNAASLLQAALAALLSASGAVGTWLVGHAIHIGVGLAAGAAGTLLAALQGLLRTGGALAVWVAGHAIRFTLGLVGGTADTLFGAVRSAYNALKSLLATSLTLTVNLAGTAADIIRRGMDASGGLAGAIGSLGGAIGSIGGALGGLLAGAIPVKAAASGPFKVTSIDWSAVQPIVLTASAAITAATIHLKDKLVVEGTLNLDRATIVLPKGLTDQVALAFKAGAITLPKHLSDSIALAWASVPKLTLPHLSETIAEAWAAVPALTLPKLSDTIALSWASLPKLTLPSSLTVNVGLSVTSGAAMAAQIGTQLSANVSAAFSGAESFAASLSTHITAALAGHVETKSHIHFQALGFTIDTDIGAGMSSNVSAAFSGAASMLISLGAWIKGHVDAQFSSVSGLAGAIAGWIGWQTGLNDRFAHSGLGTFLTNSGTWIKEHVSPFFSNVKDLAGVIAGWMGGQTGLNYLDGATGFGTFLTQAGTWIKHHVASFFDKVQGLSGAIPGWIAGKMSAAENLFKFAQPVMDWATEIYNDVLELTKEWTKVGGAILDGIATGITTAWNSGTKSLQNAINRLGDNIINGLKNKLGIHSPSTVMAWHGEMLMAGLAQGILASQRLPQQALNRAVAGLSVPGVRGAYGMAGAGAGGGIIINIQSVNLPQVRDPQGFSQWMTQLANQAVRR